MFRSSPGTLRLWGVLACFLLVILQRASGDLELGLPAAADRSVSLRDAHLVDVPLWMDRNGNRVADALEYKYRREGKAGLQAPGSPPAADLLIGLDHPPNAADLARYRAMGAGTPHGGLEGWREFLYVIRARFPAARLSPAMLEQLGRQPGVIWVEENAVARLAGYFANRQTRARAVWAAGWEGNPNHTLAILDSGIDGTHPDLAGRLIAWVDFAGVDALLDGDEYALPNDRVGHGTAMAGLAAGSGAAAGVADGVGSLNITFALIRAACSG